MSRIDEALQRASIGVVTDRDEIPESGEHTVRQADDRMLDRYPREGRKTSERAPGHELSSSRVVAAPRTGGRGQLAPVNAALQGKLVVSSQTSPVAVEQYRRLAATLHGIQGERGLKTLLVTSAVPQEGKTLTVANLALTLSESYNRRVLLIDADLRRPSIHGLFGLPNVTGLSEVLRSPRSPLSLLEVSPHLSILPSGQPDQNPMAKLTSERMRALLDEAASAFDWVLLDAPPVGLMPDADLLAHLTHAVVFVIAAGFTPYALVERAVKELGPDCIIGTVLNRVDERTLPTTGYYDRYYRPATSEK